MSNRIAIENGKIVKLNSKASDPVQNAVVEGAEFRIDGYWDDLTGKSWMFSDGNPAALNYAMRSAFASIPLDNEVIYGKIGSLGHLVHVSEIDFS